MSQIMEHSYAISETNFAEAESPLQLINVSTLYILALMFAPFHGH